MNRRALLKLIAGAAAALPFRAVRVRGQSLAFAADHAPMLREIAATVLPESIGRAGTDAATDGFLHWLADYHAGAYTDHGYGFTRIQKTPPLPFDLYSQQLDGLERAARTRHTSSFAALALADRRALIEAALRDANIDAMPIRPAGQHLVADLMTFYFRSSDANDLCYRAHVARYACRGLANAPRPPAKLEGAR